LLGTPWHQTEQFKGGFRKKMDKLRMTLACGRYDRTLALQDGRVVPEGVELNYIAMDPEEMFWRMARYGEFDVSEFSLAAYTILLSQGDRRFVGIPAFPSRFFRHSCIYIHLTSGIKKPEDLRGKRVGVPDYTMTACVWIRGMLEHDFGVKPTDIQWVTGGLNEPGRKQRISTKPISGLTVHLSGNSTLNDMLEKGEIDALIGAREPRCFRNGSAKVARLWPDYKETEREYFKRTGIFPIMHTIVIRRDVYEKNRWLAQSLFKAFIKSKEMCLQEMANQSTLKCTLPWMIWEMEQTVRLMGDDFWPYGIETNRRTLETFVAYCREQGLMESRVEVSDLFAPETSDPSRI
jgi:4,5-dihydroxyphthalate decarboxylase